MMAVVGASLLAIVTRDWPRDMPWWPTLNTAWSGPLRR